MQLWLFIGNVETNAELLLMRSAEDAEDNGVACYGVLARSSLWGLC